MFIAPHELDSWVMITLLSERVLIGVAFILIASEIFVIIYSLGTQLMFRRTLSSFAIILVACGAARLVDSVLIVQMLYHNYWFSMFAAVVDGLSAAAGLAGVVALFPIMLNACGWHIPLGRL